MAADKKTLMARLAVEIPRKYIDEFPGDRAEKIDAVTECLDKGFWIERDNLSHMFIVRDYPILNLDPDDYDGLSEFCDEHYEEFRRCLSYHEFAPEDLFVWLLY